MKSGTSRTCLPHVGQPVGHAAVYSTSHWTTGQIQVVMMRQTEHRFSSLKNGDDDKKLPMC